MPSPQKNGSMKSIDSRDTLPTKSRMAKKSNGSFVHTFNSADVATPQTREEDSENEDDIA